MDIPKNVILDLLPMYLADEVSADTRVFVEKYLETNPELAKIAKDSAAMALPEDIPIPLSKEDKMEAYKDAQQYLFKRTVIWAGLIAFAILSSVGLALLAYFMLISS